MAHFKSRTGFIIFLLTKFKSILYYILSIFCSLTSPQLPEIRVVHISSQIVFNSKFISPCELIIVISLIVPTCTATLNHHLTAYPFSAHKPSSVSIIETMCESSSHSVILFKYLIIYI